MRRSAASALGQWGAAAVTPGTLVRLLELSREPNGGVRCRAAVTVEQCGAVSDEEALDARTGFRFGLLKESEHQSFAGSVERACDRAFQELEKLAEAMIWQEGEANAVGNRAGWIGALGKSLCKRQPL